MPVCFLGRDGALRKHLGKMSLGSLRVLKIFIALFGSLPVPLRRFRGILRNLNAFLIEQPKYDLGTRVSLTGGLPQPFEALGGILRNSLSFRIGSGQIELRFGVSRLGLVAKRIEFGRLSRNQGRSQGSGGHKHPEFEPKKHESDVPFVYRSHSLRLQARLASS